MKSEINYSLDKLRKAYESLKIGVELSIDELDKDGVIQRFEFTFELLWKTVKIFLVDQGLRCNSPKETFRVAFKNGFVEDENVLLLMLEDRNNTTHLYNKDESEKIFLRIKKSYINEISKIINKLS